MTREISKGMCGFCNATFSKAAMTNHLKSCRGRKAAPETSSEKRKRQKTRSFHLVVEGRGLPEYWMHLSAPVNTTLKDLDSFLRDTWLECCGHLSAFTIEGTRCSCLWLIPHGSECVDIPVRNVVPAESQITTRRIRMSVRFFTPGTIKLDSIQKIDRALRKV